MKTDLNDRIVGNADELLKKSKASIKKELEKCSNDEERYMVHRSYTYFATQLLESCLEDLSTTMRLTVLNVLLRHSLELELEEDEMREYEED